MSGKEWRWSSLVLAAFIGGGLLTAVFLTATGQATIKAFLGSDATAAAWVQGVGSVLAVFVAIGVGVYQNVTSRSIAKAQNKPLLRLTAICHSRPPTCVMELSNRGIGPAIIESVVVLLDDQPTDQRPQNFWTGVLCELDWPDAYAGGTWLMEGQAVAAGERLEVFGAKFDRNELETRVMHAELSRLSICIRYRSIYGESDECEFRQSAPPDPHEEPHADA